MTLKRVRYLQKLLAVVGMEGRLQLEWISSAEAEKFVRVVTDFTERMKALGPSPLAIFNKRIDDRAPRPFRQSAAEMKLPEPSSPFLGHQKLKSIQGDWYESKGKEMA